MSNNFQYAYIVGNLFFVIIWIIIFLWRSDLRKKILKISLITSVMGPISEFFYFRDYWQPRMLNGFILGIEDLLFGFCIGGISAVIYDVIFSKKYTKQILTTHSKWIFVAFIFGVIWMFVGSMFLNLNSIYVSISGFLVIGIIILFYRYDLLKNALFSGLLMAILMLIYYFIFTHIFNGIIEKWWKLDNISGIIILGAPLEELVWGFSLGFLVGPLYKFVGGLKSENI